MTLPFPDLESALAHARSLDAGRAHAQAAEALDAALARFHDAAPTLRFQALVLRCDLAVSLNDLGEGRGILAEARQVRLTAQEREALGADLRRADDLEAFFTHRGCAG